MGRTYQKPTLIAFSSSFYKKKRDMLSPLLRQSRDLVSLIKLSYGSVGSLHTSKQVSATKNHWEKNTLSLKKKRKKERKTQQGTNFQETGRKKTSYPVRIGFSVIAIKGLPVMNLLSHTHSIQQSLQRELATYYITKLACLVKI